MLSFVMYTSHCVVDPERELALFLGAPRAEPGEPIINDEY